MSEVRLVDANGLTADLKKYYPDSALEGIESKTLFKQILHDVDNAPTVPLPDFKEGYKQAILDGKTNYSRPQDTELTKPIYYEESSVASVECETCKHKNKKSIEYPCDVCGTRAPFCHDMWEDDKK